MITLVFGPMFSGKTSFLLAYERRFLITKKKVLMIKWANDTRYSELQVVTHDGQTNKSEVINATSLFDIDHDIINQYD